MASKLLTKENRTRLGDLIAADVPLWKIEKIMSATEANLRRVFPEVFEAAGNSGNTNTTRSEYEPSEQDYKKVEFMAGHGIPKDSIALVLGISSKTFNRYFSEAVETGKTNADLRVASSLLKMATGDPNGKNTAQAAIWWTKARMQWKDVSRIESTGADGGAIINQVQIVLPDNGRDTDENLLTADAPRIESTGSE